MTITRRTILAGTALAAAPIGGSAALAQTSPATPSTASSGSQSQQAPGFYRYKVGDIEVTAINDGFARRPVEGFIKNAEIKDVQAALQEAFLPTEAFPITFNTLVLNQGGKITLIDTGNGDMGAPTSGRWMANFRAAGFNPAQVNTVVISHFHGDHINGLRLKDGTAVFPNAEVMVPAAEWAFWMDDARMNQAPEVMKGAFQGVRRVFGSIAQNVKRYEMDKEVVPEHRRPWPYARPHGLHALLRLGQVDDHVGCHEPSGPVRTQSRLVGRLRHGRGAGPRHPPSHARHGGYGAVAGGVLSRPLPGYRPYCEGRQWLPVRAGAVEPGGLTRRLSRPTSLRSASPGWRHPPR
jgi:glyoxylase-like metal-dependent hydrolase (beta-lactamase superfamily II)